MTVPVPVDFKTLPAGGVFQQTTDNTFFVKCDDASSVVRLSDGHLQNGYSGIVLYFASAALAV